MVSPAEETSPLQSIQNTLERKAVEHPEFDLERWVYHAGTKFRTPANEVVCHISKYVTDQGQHLFIISDHSKILSPMYLKKPANLTNIPPAWRQPISHYSVLKDIVTSAKANPQNVSVLVSSELEGTTVVVRYNKTSTITIKNRALRGILSSSPDIKLIQMPLPSDLEEAIDTSTTQEQDPAEISAVKL
jgi:hypothetical protein